MREEVGGGGGRKGKNYEKYFRHYFSNIYMAEKH